MISPVELRPACPADAPAVRRLAERDSARVPRGRLLVAESGGELLAALSLDTGAAIADPFQPTAHVLEALRAHSIGERRTRWSRRRPWLQPAM